jgi:hypothetical protein
MLDRLKGLGPIAWIIGNWQLVLAIAGGAVLVLAGTYFLGRSHGYDSCEAEQLETMREAKALEDASEGAAAGEREADTGTIATNKEKRDAAIDAAGEEGAAPSPSRTALNCERLRAAGADLDEFPACRGRAGQAQAPAYR